MRLFVWVMLLTLCLTEKNMAQTLIRGPYMNMATPHSIIIQWRTDMAINSRVQYGTDPNNLNMSAELPILTTEHSIKLINLLPDTKYYYNIGTSLFILQGDHQNYFRTAPVAHPKYNKPIRFWAMGDMGKATPQETAVKEAFKKYVDTNYVDGFILLGDNAYPSGFDSDYQYGFFNYFQNDITKHTVLWPCLGNHDYANDNFQRMNHQIVYFDIFSNPQNAEMGGVASNNERYYSFNYGNIHFVNLDSYGLENVSGNYYGLADTAFSPQVQWLKYDLSQNTMPWVIVSYHHPPYCMGTHNSDYESDLVALRTNLNPILEKYNVDLVLNGHCHSYQRSNFIKNHFGLEASFDSSLHLVQNTSGRYDGTPNSCMYIKNTGSKKDSGVIYAVVGSGSAIPQWAQMTWPHSAMQYSNYLDNGSMLVTVEGNSLHAVWISTDTMQVVKDEFTIIKQANTKKTIQSNYPATIPLKASWKNGKHLWSTGDTTQQIIWVATHDTVLYVSDSWNCLTDTFHITDAGVMMGQSIHETFTATLFPNPTSKQIRMELMPNTQYELILSTETGQTIMKYKWMANDKMNTISLPEHIIAGTYILSVKNDKNQFFTSKITLLE